VGEALHVGDESAAALVEKAKRAIDLLHLQHDGPDPFRVLAEIPPGPSPFADRLVDHEQRVAGAEGGGALVPLAFHLGAAAPQLDEVEVVDEEAPGSLQVVDVVVERVDPPDPKRRAVGHGFSLPPAAAVVASGCVHSWGCAPSGSPWPPRSPRRCRPARTRNSASWPTWVAPRPSRRSRPPPGPVPGRRDPAPRWGCAPVLPATPPCRTTAPPPRRRTRGSSPHGSCSDRPTTGWPGRRPG